MLRCSAAACCHLWHVASTQMVCRRRVLPAAAPIVPASSQQHMRHAHMLSSPAAQQVMCSSPPPHQPPSRRTCPPAPLLCSLQPQEAMARGSLQLLDSIDAKDGQGPPGAVELPGGFLEDYCSKREQEELQATIGPVGGWQGGNC